MIREQGVAPGRSLAGRAHLVGRVLRVGKMLGVGIEPSEDVAQAWVETLERRRAGSNFTLTHPAPVLLEAADPLEDAEQVPVRNGRDIHAVHAVNGPLNRFQSFLTNPHEVA